MTNYRVEKQHYSAGAWRVLTADGVQVWQHGIEFEHVHLGTITISGPVCFDRKRDALAWVAAQS